MKEINKNTSIEKLKSFYNQLVEEEVIGILDFDKIELSEIITRAVWKKKPFSDGKTEIKEFARFIWLTYASVC